MASLTQTPQVLGDHVWKPVAASPRSTHSDTGREKADVETREASVSERGREQKEGEGRKLNDSRGCLAFSPVTGNEIYRRLIKVIGSANVNNK